VKQGETFMSMESGKWVGRGPALVSGKLLEVNEELEFEPTRVNELPFGDGWLVKIEMSDPAELETLLKAGSAELKTLVEAEAEKYGDVLG